MNIILLDHVIAHRSLFERWAKYGHTFKGCSFKQYGHLVINIHLVMGVLILYLMSLINVQEHFL
jgi:hypothetical protein